MSAIETASPRASWSASETAPRISEDWLSVIIGLVIFVLALAVLANVDLIGWVVTTSVWSNFSQALGTASKTYAPLGGAGALLATYVALLAVLSAAAVALKADVRKFALGFTAVFWIPTPVGSSAATPMSPPSRRPSCSASASVGRCA